MSEADWYVLLCGLMFALKTFIKPTRFQCEIGPHFVIDLYFEDINSIAILILR